MTCRFCDAPAIAIYRLSSGCFCYPDDRQQALCPQHIVRASPIAEMELQEILDPRAFRWFEETMNE